MEFTTINEAMEIQGVNTSNNLETLIPEIMNVISQTHIWHLLCTSGQKHMALGEFYTELQDEVDELAETYIGMGGTINSIEPFTPDVVYTDSKVISYIKDFKEMVNMCISSTDKSEMRSIQEELIEIQELIYSFVYKFNMD